MSNRSRIVNGARKNPHEYTATTFCCQRMSRGKISTSNKFMVQGAGPDQVQLLAFGMRVTKEDALNLAAWLVAVTRNMPPHELRFKDVLQAVEGGWNEDYE